MKNDQNGYSLIEVIVIILIFVALAIAGIDIRSWHSGNNKTNSTVTAANVAQNNITNDVKTQYDLALIAKALNDYYSNSVSSTTSSELKTLIPSKLAQLNIIGLYKPISYYTYIPGNQSPGGPNSSSWQLCASFNRNTFTPEAYGDLTINDGGETVNDYGVHSSGQQCFENMLGPESSFSLILNNTETKIMTSVCDKPTINKSDPPFYCESFLVD